MEGWTWARPHPPGLGGKESPGAPPNPRAAPSCPPSPARPRPEEPPAACEAAERVPHPHPLPPPARRGPRARYLLVEAADHGLDPFHRPVCGHVLPATRGRRMTGWAGVRDPPEGGRRLGEGSGEPSS